MSDPAKSSAEIEDVLSSIRRLVSDGAPSARSNGATSGGGTGKLVLTPALRVAEPEEPGPQTGAAEAAFLPEDRLSDFGPVPTAGPEEARSADATEPATSVPQPDAALPAGKAPDGADTKEKAEDGAWPTSDLAHALRGLAAARGAGVADGAMDDRKPAGQPDTAAVQDFDVSAEDRSQIGAQDAGGADAAPQPKGPAEDNAPFTPSNTGQSVLNEDALREMIVEIVREELRGHLGQRLTRNLRKMVRREIRLALAAEKLE